MTFFAFPLNLILAVLWLTAIFYLYRHAGNSRPVRWLLSSQATVISISLFVLFCLFIGITGKRETVSSWPFVAVMFFLMTVLFFVIIRGWKHGDKVRWRFLLNHAGLLLALSSAFWGAPDSQTMKLQAYKDISTREAYRPDGSRVWLSYEIELKDLEAEYHENGTPSSFIATLKIGEDVEQTLRVNHPYSRTLSEDIYLSGYDTDQEKYCVIQIVKEPWKYPALAGILMMLAGAMLLFIQGPLKKERPC